MAVQTCFLGREKAISSKAAMMSLSRRVPTYRRAPASPASAARDLSSKISNVLAYFSRYALVNDLAHGLP
jgi:predicted nucleic acid-binding Zn ribbon protein